ncbi:hypothetical protein HXV88_08555 [Aeromonas veronii]|uniref:hypothetical protein n=1 Tax=Aeromonas veronii TaxID=654 RepID=UPI0015CF90A5|nr:hypothetical protein [Aeromonas veronii]QLH66502.1 hypothetical protein HXV88_08555 [Aeromonas veronii]
MSEVNEPTVKIGNNNSNNSISIFGMDISKAISTGVVIGCLILGSFCLNIKYENVLDEVHVVQVEQEKLKEQVNTINQNYKRQLDLSTDIMNENNDIMEKVNVTMDSIDQTIKKLNRKL